jgi:hypothetical protein
MPLFTVLERRRLECLEQNSIRAGMWSDVAVMRLILLKMTAALDSSCHITWVTLWLLTYSLATAAEVCRPLIWSQDLGPILYNPVFLQSLKPVFCVQLSSRRPAILTGVFDVFLSILPPGKCRDSILKYVTTAIYAISNPLFDAV